MAVSTMNSIKNISYHFLLNQFFQSANIIMFSDKGEDSSSSSDGGFEPETVESDKGDEDAKMAITYGEWIEIAEPHHHHHH